MSELKDFLWSEIYRPKTIDETILPKRIKDQFKHFMKSGNLPNFMLFGTPGIGKTTAAKAMLHELDADYIEINGSMDGNIDTLRTKIAQFASSVSFKGGRKYVLLDEADFLNANSTQPALRNFMEQYSKNCGFILTCNHKNRIIDALHSRCAPIDFSIAKKESPNLAKHFFDRVETILKNENVEYDSQVVTKIIMSHFPDWRRCLNELQRASGSGKINEGALGTQMSSVVEVCLKLMKDKKFTDVRKWIAENSDVESATFYKILYDKLPKMLSNTQSIAACIILLAEYEYKEAFVANVEINRVAALASIMAEADWK